MSITARTHFHSASPFASPTRSTVSGRNTYMPHAASAPLSPVPAAGPHTTPSPTVTQLQYVPVRTNASLSVSSRPYSVATTRIVRRLCVQEGDRQRTCLAPDSIYPYDSAFSHSSPCEPHPSSLASPLPRFARSLSLRRMPPLRVCLQHVRTRSMHMRAAVLAIASVSCRSRPLHAHASRPRLTPHAHASHIRAAFASSRASASRHRVSWRPPPPPSERRCAATVTETGDAS